MHICDCKHIVHITFLKENAFTQKLNWIILCNKMCIENVFIDLV